MMKNIISFDLDDTLICTPLMKACDNRVPWLLRGWLNERIRSGSAELITQLGANNWTVYIYTTSYRSSSYIRSLLGCYGIKPAKIINQLSHDQLVKQYPQRQ